MLGMLYWAQKVMSPLLKLILQIFNAAIMSEIISAILLFCESTAWKFSKQRQIYVWFHDATILRLSHFTAQSKAVAQQVGKLRQI